MQAKASLSFARVFSPEWLMNRCQGENDNVGVYVVGIVGHLASCQEIRWIRLSEALAATVRLTSLSIM